MNQFLPHRSPMRTRHLPSRQSGFTLVELLVAMFIGLLLIAGAVGVYVASSRLGRAQDAATTLQDFGNYTLQQITRGVQRAGYVDWLASTNSYASAFAPQVNDAISHAGPANSDAFHLMFGGAAGVTGNIAGTNTTSAVFGCDGASGPVNGGYSCGVRPGFSGLSIAYQSLALAGASNNYSPSLPAAAIGSGGATDCNGQRPDLAGLNFVANRYYVDASNQLMCLGNGGAGAAFAQPMASNVIAFVVLYGLAAAGTENPTRWVTAAQVTNWALVTSLQICLGLQGAVGSAPNPNTVVNCFGQNDPQQNSQLRRYFRTTINLRNATYAAKALPTS